MSSFQTQLLAIDAITLSLRQHRLPSYADCVTLCDQIGPVRDWLAARVADEKRIQLEERAFRERSRRTHLSEIQREAQKRR